MALDSDIQQELTTFVEGLYTGKDTMHDWTHVERVRKRALEFSESKPCNIQLLSTAACLHGVISSHEDQIRAFLADRGLQQANIDRIVSVARESQKDTAPESVEGQLLHDAHLLEGDTNFMLTKTLVTGSARGQTLAETLVHFEANVVRFHCFFPENQREAARREEIAREYLAKLKAEL